MADRSVKVSLLADVRGFVSGVQRATAESRKMAQDLGSHAAKNAEAYDKVGKGLTGVGLLAGAAGAATVLAFANFDQQMSEVQAATGATGAPWMTCARRRSGLVLRRRSLRRRRRRASRSCRRLVCPRRTSWAAASTARLTWRLLADWRWLTRRRSRLRP